MSPFSEEIFALDIGTRKVMGIIARRQEEFLEILDAEVIEHTSRAMLDGQIHSIEEVARTVNKIKACLETRSNRKLKDVGVAVAGRNLLTFKSKAARDFEFEQEITPAMVRGLELQAVEAILSDNQQDVSRFYCAGYSPVYYELDGTRISCLSGHRGKAIACELIVTFLPRIVLESMFAVLKKAGLEASNITLEPIAAFNAIIPPEIRNLNIALLDIGAGTSDLALTKDGHIFAYGMVNEAGDEITECVSELLLVDFCAAETIKRSLDKPGAIEYKDIWGRPHTIEPEKVIELLSERIKKLAESVAQKTLALNGTPPQAVVAVGGGAQTVNLIRELALALGLGQERAGLRLPSAIKNIKDASQKLTGPESITPIGIALMTASSWGLRFIEIEVNLKKFRMLDFHQKKDIISALTLSGAINHKRLYPKPGMAITCTVNGELKIIKGSLGEPARITLNGNPVSSLAQIIKDGDILTFEEASPGKDAFCRIKDLSAVKTSTISFNREIIEVNPSLLMNGKEADLDTAVSDRADIRILPLTVKDALRHNGLDVESFSERQILVNINGNPRMLTQRNFTLTLNGKSAGLDAELKPNDVIAFSQEIPTFYKIKDVVNIPEGTRTMHITVSGKEIDMLIEPAQIFMNGRMVSPDEFLIDGAEIKVYILKEQQILLSEIFRYIDFNPNEALGKRMKIMVNDMPAGFTTPLSEGSRVRISFEDREAAQ